MYTLVDSKFLYAFFIAVLFFFVADLDQVQAKKNKYAAIVMDAKTGKILHSKNSYARRYPASLTKIMTLYILFDYIESGKLNKSSRIKISRKAANMQPSKLGIKAGESIKVEQAINALVIKSANDIAVAVSEHVGKSESEFANMMTKQARKLGMKNTVFQNASGLPDRKQYTTAYDMAILGIALREHFPQYYHYFSRNSFKYNGRLYANHNQLLKKVSGMEGIKTGYTRASGFNLLSSVFKNNRQIVAVVMGGRTSESRDAHMSNLIKKYLPYASKGRKKILLAKRPSKSMPIPKFQRKFNHTLSSKESTIKPDIYTTILSYADISNADLQEIFTKNGRKPIIYNHSKPAVIPTPKFFKSYQQSRLDSYQIQIGAISSKNLANALLIQARKKIPKLLKPFKNHIESIQKGGNIMYRARFSGFSSNQQARGVCSNLRKYKFDCMVFHVPNK